MEFEEWKRRLLEVYPWFARMPDEHLRTWHEQYPEVYIAGYEMNTLYRGALGVKD